jgi:Ca2+-binding RTX toxin-like protein
MAILGILLLVGGAMAGLVGLGGLDLPEVEQDATSRNPADADPDVAGQVKPDHDLLLGTDSAEALTGGRGGDWLIGLDGADTLSGGAGGDVIIPGDGADAVLSGNGNDFVEAANIVDEQALRASVTKATDIFGVTFGYALPAKSDAGDDIDLGAGDDTVVAGSDDTVIGGPGADEFALGDWIAGGAPVEITDFDAAEDIITFVYDREGASPELSVERNETTGITTIKADGQTVAILRDTSPAFSLRNVAVGRYTA